MYKCVAFYLPSKIMRGYRKFCQRGSNSTLTSFFLVDEGRDDPNGFHLQADDGLTLNAGLVAL